MAKNPKKISATGIHPEDFMETRIPEVELPEHKHDYDDTHTHEYTHNHVDIKQPEQKERKKKRVQLLTLESLIDRMDAYAAKRGVPRVAVFEAAVTAYLDMVDPQD